MAEQGGHGIGSYAVLPEVLFTHHFDCIRQVLFFQQRFNGNARVGFLLRRGLFEFEHLIFTSQHDGGLEAHITHIAHKGGLQGIVITEPHLYAITAPHWDFRRAVPLDTFRQCDFANIGQLFGVEGDFHLRNLVYLPRLRARYLYFSRKPVHLKGI